ncbi:hypothetical protein CSC68_08425 [Pseudoxanthomonas suwonensis]|nr:hypothetical protein CSC68_08425 [Pseudoxanthomonas suwonensis]
MEAWMELRETIGSGVRIELTAVAAVLMLGWGAKPGGAAALLGYYLAGVAAMALVAYLTHRPGQDAFLGWHRDGRLRIGLAQAPALAMLALLGLSAPHVPYAWVAGICGLWLGQRVGWLLRNSRSEGQARR